MVRIWRWMVQLLVALGVMLTLFPALAGADKSPQPVVFSQAKGAIAVVSIYESPAASQAATLKALLKTGKGLYKTVPGFTSLSLLASTDGTRLLTLSQWQDQASYEAFQASPTKAEEADYTKYYEKYKKSQPGEAEVSSPPAPLITGLFEVEQVARAPGMVAAISGEHALVQVTALAADSPEHQAELLGAATAALDTLPKQYPAPRSAIVLRGLDTNAVALVVPWGAGAEFEDWSQVPQFAVNLELKESASDATLPATWLTQDEALYQVVKVITPKLPKAEKD